MWSNHFLHCVRCRLFELDFIIHLTYVCICVCLRLISVVTYTKILEIVPRLDECVWFPFPGFITDFKLPSGHILVSSKGDQTYYILKPLHTSWAGNALHITSRYLSKAISPCKIQSSTCTKREMVVSMFQPLKNLYWSKIWLLLYERMNVHTHT